MNPSWKRTFIFGDLHFPFHNKVALAVALYYCRFYRPEIIVQAGDLRDWYSASHFSRKVNLFTPQEEDREASYLSEWFWEKLGNWCPDAEKYQLLGNHCVRPIKRIGEVAPEFEEDYIPLLHERYTFDGVKTIYDPREELDLHGVRFIHGYKSKLGEHAAFNRMPVVCGHTHRGGVAMLNLHNEIIWELNAGYLADASHPALSYTMQKRATNWTLGFGTLDADGPRFHGMGAEFLRSVAGSEYLKNYSI